MTEKISIAIDGPAGAGKSTVARIIAERKSYIYIDTGSMYRALTYKALQGAFDPSNEQQLYQLLKETEIILKTGETGQEIFLDGKDVTNDIRSREINANVSMVSSHRLIREEMVARQQQLAKAGGVVMDGRDIGTHVMPSAEVKVFLIASVGIRAKRRHEENLAKGFSSDLTMLQAEISARDKFDSEREVSPLVKAEDAIELDTSNLTIEEVVEEILKMVDKRLKK